MAPYLANLFISFAALKLEFFVRILPKPAPVIVGTLKNRNMWFEYQADINPDPGSELIIGR